MHYAFHCEAMKVGTRGGWETTIPETAQDRLTPADRIADGVLLKGICLSAAGQRGATVLVAYYTRPYEQCLTERKLDRLKTLAKWLHAEGIRQPEVCDWIVGQWAGLMDRRGSLFWSKELEIPRGTIRRWKHNGIGKLKGWRMVAEDRVGVELRERGLL